jgi:RNA polymerase sigma-70 factor, ECF subfamily
MVSDTQKNDDTELLVRYMAGDEDAFSEIVGRYKNPLYAFLRKFLNQQALVEDVFQDTFLQLYASREKFDTDRPLRPWLFTIAANKAKDALRKIQRRSEMSLGTAAISEEVSIDDLFNMLSSYEQTPLDEVSKDETARQVRVIIADLPENLRIILTLSYFEQFSYKQMAEILSIPIGTVKSRLHTAVLQFARKWRSLNGSDEG